MVGLFLSLHSLVTYADVLYSYIVDFEDWHDIVGIDGATNWSDLEYNDWEMAEKFTPLPSTGLPSPPSSDDERSKC